MTMALDTETPDAALSGDVSVQLRHKTLNTTLKGLRHAASSPDAVVHQFRGIKYAHVPARFRRSVIQDVYPPHTDATRHGPNAPQIKNKWLESRLYGLPSEIIPRPAHAPPMDEFECLNLNVTTPAPVSLPEDLRGKACLPVLVWIHGGGNVTGAANEWICDSGPLVRRSIELGTPVVIVSINYRLGLLGFGASELLRQDNASVGEEGVGNYGLHDQRTALIWIRRHIAGFGGDTSNVTLFGSSWGAADIHAHLLSSANYADITTPPSPTSHGPLFHRAILQSGALVPSSSVVQDVASAGRHLARIMSALHNITTVEQLRAVPAAKLVALTGERVRPVDDGVFLRPDWKTLSLPVAPPATEYGQPAWRQDIMVGDVACESVLWAIPARLWGADAVARRARAIVQSVRRADTLMRAYDIVEDVRRGNVHFSVEEALLEGSSSEDVGGCGGEGSDAEEAECELAERVMELINDVAFAWPVDVAARCAADSAYVPSDVAVHGRGEDDGQAESNYLVVPSPIVPSRSLSRSSFGGTDSDSATQFSPSPSPVGGRNPFAPLVYRYVFDQASPYTATPHHGVDLLYLFGNIPFPADPELTEDENAEVNWDRVKIRAEMQERWLMFANGRAPWEPLTPQAPTLSEQLAEAKLGGSASSSRSSSFSFSGGSGGLSGLSPMTPLTSLTSMSGSSPFSALSSAIPDPRFLNSHSHNALHHSGPSGIGGHHTPHGHSHIHSHQHLHGGHSPAFVHAHTHTPANMPISISETDRVFVFGPEGETGARSKRIFEGRRRVHAWREALAPLGLATAQKVGLELGNGPPVAGLARF